jgi:hypothetical protein
MHMLLSLQLRVRQPWLFKSIRKSNVTISSEVLIQIIVAIEDSCPILSLLPRFFFSNLSRVWKDLRDLEVAIYIYITDH